MKYKIVRQPDEMNCGVACLAMICAYHGVDNMSLAVIRELAQTDREGNSMYSLKLAAEKLHLTAEGYDEVEKEDLLGGELKFPVIIHTIVDGLYLHYMVLFEANEKGVVLGDPANGQVEMSWDNFLRIWTNQVMELTPTENFKENKKYRKNYKFIFSLIKKYKKYLILLFVISGIISAISIVAARFYSNLVDSVIPKNNLELLGKLLLLTSGIYIFTVGINWLKLKVTIKFNRFLDKELIINIYNRMTDLPMKFFASRTAGDLSTRFSDGDAIRGVITDFTFDFVIDFVYAIFAIITLFINHSWQLVVLTILMLEIVALIQFLFKKKLSEISKKTIKANTEVYSYANASFMGHETIKSYNSENYVETTMAQKYKQYQDSAYTASQFSQAQSDLSGTIIKITGLFMLSFLAILTMRGEISPGELMYLYTLVGYISAPVGYIMNLQEQMYEIDAALERLDDVFRSTTEKDINKSRKNLNEKITSVEFKDVVFQYGFKDPVIKGLSFKINEGESIGIIGTSGSGKTTLIKLILSFYKVTKGKILINGKNIDDLTTSSIRQKIAYVSQNDFWFQDTIFNNLTLGNKKASVEDVERVLEEVQMKEFVDEQPRGLNTMIEEGAVNLSTGQKQRLSIAKALIMKPDVLVLDESTSNLDAKTEEFIVNSLSHEKDKIKIVIAHRLNTLSRCDKIIALNDGVISECGTPAELLKTKGMFYELWSTQNKAMDKKKKKIMEGND